MVHKKSSKKVDDENNIFVHHGASAFQNAKLPTGITSLRLNTGLPLGWWAIQSHVRQQLGVGTPRLARGRCGGLRCGCRRARLCFGGLSRNVGGFGLVRSWEQCGMVGGYLGGVSVASGFVGRGGAWSGGGPLLALGWAGRCLGRGCWGGRGRAARPTRGAFFNFRFCPPGGTFFNSRFCPPNRGICFSNFFKLFPNCPSQVHFNYFSTISEFLN